MFVHHEVSCQSGLVTAVPLLLLVVAKPSPVAPFQQAESSRGCSTLGRPLHQLKKQPVFKLLRGVHSQPSAAKKIAGAVQVAVRALKSAAAAVRKRQGPAAMKKRLSPAVLVRLQLSNPHQVGLEGFCRVRSWVRHLQALCPECLRLLDG